MNKTKIFIHISLWLAYIFTYALLWNIPQYSFLKNLWYVISLLPFKLILVYSAIYLANHFLFKSQYIRFIIAIVVLSFICGILNQLYVHFIVAKFFPELHLTAEGLWHWGRITKRMTFMNSAMLIALTLVILNKYYVQKDITARILNEKLSAELKLLKNQLHPHFFFNTLNNLYSLALQKSDLAPVMILKLSDLMRYTLDQADKEKVSLEEEIEFIKNYAAIEEIRYGEKVTMNWKIDITESGILIPPLTLSTFMENAFKHAVSKARENITIDISLSIIDEYIHYTVINSIPLMEVEKVKEIKKKEIGLNNLKQRLELMYKKNYIFKTQETAASFQAFLSIPINHEDL